MTYPVPGIVIGIIRHMDMVNSLCLIMHKFMNKMLTKGVKSCQEHVEQCTKKANFARNMMCNTYGSANTNVDVARAQYKQKLNCLETLSSDFTKNFKNTTAQIYLFTW